jgi:carbonic anhydrase
VRHPLGRDLIFDYYNPYDPATGAGRPRREATEEAQEVGDVRPKRSLTAFDWNGRDLRIDWAPGSTIAQGMFDRISYNLYSIEFHTPSEYTHNGKESLPCLPVHHFIWT